MQRITTILACLFVSLNCLSQSKVSGGQYPFVHYTPKDGLVNSRVKKAYQDSKGRMYFLTYGGLSVYDGARFKNYTKQSGLVTDVLNDILEVGDDSLLVATNSEHNVNVLIKGKMVILKKDGARCGIINQFYRHDDGKLYLSCDDGLFTLENMKVRELDVSYLSKTSRELPYMGNISGVGNSLVFCTHELRDHRGLYVYDIRNNRVSDALPELQVYLLGKDNTNHIWIAMSGKLYTLDSDALSKGKLSLVPPESVYAQAKDYSTVNIAFGENSIWFLFRNKEYRNIEIHRIAETGNLSRIPLPAQATASAIKNIFVDKENTIWLCNEGEGIFKIVSAPFQIFENPFGTSAQGYSSNNAFCSNDITWHSTSVNKLFKRSEKGLEEFSCNLQQSPNLFYANGNKLLARDSRNIYEGTCDNQKKIIRFAKLISLPDSDYFASKTVLDPYGTIIAAQKNALGIWKNKNLIAYKPINRVDVIEELVFDKHNLLWVVKRYTGIDVFKLHPGDPMNYLQPVYHFEKEKIIGSPRCCVVDKKGLIWIGTRENGIIAYRLEGDRLNKLLQFDAGNGLTDNFATTLACDSSNNIIVGTQTGLDRIVFDSNSHRIENLAKSGNFFAFISQAWADTKHAYAFTSSGTLLQLSSGQKTNTNNFPRLLLEEMKVNAQTVSSEKHTFRYKENNISFLVAAPSFIDEKQVAFSYLLAGSRNERWSDTTVANSVINLTNLSAGQYVLKVKAFFSSTTYPPSEVSYPFEVAPPWWQTWWFRSLAGILIVGLLISGLRFYYRRKLERRMTVLEKQQAVEKERTRIATDMHDDLGAGLSRIKFLSETIGIKKQKNQPIEEEISKIRDYSREMIQKMGEIVWALNEKNDSLSDLLAYSRAYAMEYLSQSGIECEVTEPDQYPTSFVSGEFRRNIYLVVKEALHNIAKHAQANHVKLRIDVDSAVVVTIKDDGIGFDRSQSRPFSNGLSNMEKRMRDIGGDIIIKNENGTTVVLTAPLNR